VNVDLWGMKIVDGFGRGALYHPFPARAHQDQGDRVHFHHESLQRAIVVDATAHRARRLRRLRRRAHHRIEHPPTRRQRLVHLQIPQRDRRHREVHPAICRPASSDRHATSIHTPGPVFSLVFHVKSSSTSSASSQPSHSVIY